MRLHPSPAMQARVDRARLALDRAERAVLDHVGRRGLRAIQAMPKATYKEMQALARKYRRKGRPLKACADAMRAYPAAQAAFASYRAQARSDVRWGLVRWAREHAGRDLREASADRWPSAPLRKHVRPLRTTADLRELRDSLRRDEITCRLNVYSHGDWPRVRWVESAEECGIDVGFEKDYNGYSKRCRFPMVNYSVEARAVPMPAADLPGGKRNLDGLLTLAATPVPSPDGTARAWDTCVWLERSRGVSWHTRRGAIVQIGDQIAHGKTVKTALATLRARMTRAQRDYLVTYCRVSREDALAHHGDRKLRWRHARRAGLCASGIRAWAAAHFPDRDPQRDSVTVREALETRTSEPLILDVIRLVCGRKRTITPVA